MAHCGVADERRREAWVNRDDALTAALGVEKKTH
jgi:hypothetical protein